jgi:hypothetical protein
MSARSRLLPVGLVWAIALQTACENAFTYQVCIPDGGVPDGESTSFRDIDLLSSASHCGCYRLECPVRDNALATCTNGRCGFTCLNDFGDCDGRAENGCEVNVRTEAQHCGSCGRSCEFRNTMPGCVAGSCTIVRCIGNYASCNMNQGDGCEADLSRDLNNCGGCGQRCSFINAQASCVNTACMLGACNAGYDNCDGISFNGCEVSLNDNPAHCGVCGRSCSFPNAVARCVNRQCALDTCNMGYGDCDGMAGNGCEINTINDRFHCGVCGRVCSGYPNGAPQCAGGTCSLGSCNSGFGNCDGTSGNGCETDLRTNNSHCGACGRACAAPQVCRSGVCAP